MIKLLILGLAVSIPAWAVDKDQYCEKLHSERESFRGLTWQMDDKKLIGLYERIIPAANMSAEEMKAQAIKEKMSVNPKEMAAYKRDFYQKNCEKVIEAQKVDDSLPPEQKTCAQIEAQDPEWYIQANLHKNLKEFSDINTRSIIDIQNEAIEKKMNADDYVKLVADRTTKKDKSGKVLVPGMVVGKLAENQYLFAYHRRHCTQEAGLTNRLTTGVNAHSEDVTATINAIIPTDSSVQPQGVQRKVEAAK